MVALGEIQGTRSFKNSLSRAKKLRELRDKVKFKLKQRIAIQSNGTEKSLPVDINGKIMLDDIDQENAPLMIFPKQ